MEETLDLSFDRLLMMMMMMIIFTNTVTTIEVIQRQIIWEEDYES